MKRLLAALILCSGCDYEPSTTTHQEVPAPPPLIQPERGDYRLENVSWAWEDTDPDHVGGYMSLRRGVVNWFNLHPGIEVVSVTAISDTTAMILYKPARQPQLF